MFSQHPFALGHRYALAARSALPLWKRSVDLLCCVAGLPLLGFLTFVFTVLTRFTARGPVFYQQENSGHMGRRIRVYHFRTMRVVSHGAVQLSLVNSRRAELAQAFIPGGRFLRVSGLADLPQLVNVLRGEMSIVGPRPCLVSSSDGREGGPADQVTAMPGLTGHWRIAGGSATTRDASDRWERTYAEHMSFGRDIAIIARTALMMLGLRRDR